MTMNDPLPPKPARRPAVKHTIARDVAARLRAASEATGIPMSRLVEQGLRLRFAQLDAGARHGMQG
ncbi:hypothetical protein BE20_10660 [Sorangium cellulosum]|nr:hypothetical protein BE20_10660 [Sorangium cellulosum]